MSAGKLRARAAVILGKLLTQDGSLSTLLSRTNDAEADEDFALLQELVFGTCRWFYQLDSILQQLLEKPLKDKEVEVRCLLLAGLYQLQHMRVPDYAVVNETVAATRVLNKPWARGLVNAVLRNFLRRQSELMTAAEASPAGEFAHPGWLIDALRKDWPEQADDILRQNNQRPPMTLRINASRSTRSDYQARLQEAGIEATPGALSISSLYLDKPVPVERLPDFSAGFVSVQDEASQIIPSLLELEKGQRILDACAAPGGKTCHILEQGIALSELVALDNDARRLERLQQNLDRLDLRAKVLCGDAGDPPSWWDGQAFDRILLDAPCSATGIIRRHPDIKLLRRAADIPKLRALQDLILRQLWTTLKPGGLLLYSTCSVLKQENTDTIAEFLQSKQDAIHQRIEGQWGVECAFGRQLLPGSGGNDGFYFAILRKSA